MEIFELSRGWKITGYILLGILFVVFAFLAVFCIIEPPFEKGVVFLLPVSLVAIFFIVCGLLQMNEKVIFDNYSIRKVSRLVNREILLNDVKGYKVERNYLRIIPYEGKGKRISASNQLNGIERLAYQLSLRYPDLNLEEAQQVVDDAIRHAGGQDAQKLLKQAKTETYTLTGVTVILCVLCFLYFDWYCLALFCCVPLSLLLLLRHRGLVQLDSSKESPLPTMFMIPLFVLIVQILQTQSIYVVHYSKVWPLAIGIAVALTVMLWFCSRYLNKKRKAYLATAAIMVLIFLGNGYGFVVTTNAILDKAGHEYYEAKVIDKYTSKGKRTTYYLTLQPWAHQPESENESVSRKLYGEVEIDGKVGIYYHQGAFNIPWYQLGRAE
ncbi:hypothetical protein [Chitinophaga ginsengisoli]|uniref:Uncharacterized protein n=1 Tax=Chitinophaga ginsengisoli TaxID=363837 RepID=A0A2P8FRW2_9BACT|nr:hypothetical protein [Chitinophaga ginsengisoli]PSL24472.1 hypothetical protein CLV42_11559 [Chitinophaga ginsengisoli]